MATALSSRWSGSLAHGVHLQPGPSTRAPVADSVVLNPAFTQTLGSHTRSCSPEKPTLSFTANSMGIGLPNDRQTFSRDLAQRQQAYSTELLTGRQSCFQVRLLSEQAVAGSAPAAREQGGGTKENEAGPQAVCSRAAVSPHLPFPACSSCVRE